MKQNNTSPTSKPTSVDEQIKEIHYESISRFKEAGYLEQGNTDDVVAKINRLIVDEYKRGYIQGGIDEILRHDKATKALTKELEEKSDE